MSHIGSRTVSLSTSSPSGSPFLTTSEGAMVLTTPTLRYDFLSPTPLLSNPAVTTPGLWSLSLSPSAFGRTLSPYTHSSEPNPFETSFKRDRSSMTAEDAVGLHYLFNKERSSGLGVGVGEDTFFGAMNLGGADGRKRSLSVGIGGGDKERWGGEYWGGMGGGKRARMDDQEYPGYSASGTGSIAPSFGGSVIGSAYQHTLAHSEEPSPQTSTSGLPTPNSTHLVLPSYYDLDFNKQPYSLLGRLPSFLADEVQYPTTLPAVLPRLYEPFAFPSHYELPSIPVPDVSHESAASTPKAVEPAPTKKAPKTMRGKGKKSAVETAVEVSEEGEEEMKRKQFLERNRVAAIKSRQKKREKVGNLEKTANDLAHSNAELQATANTLLAELHALRASLDPIHPPSSCTCSLVQTYISREARGGGIPLIEGNGDAVLHRDYSKIPRLGGGDDDCYGPNGRLPSLPTIPVPEESPVEIEVDQSEESTNESQLGTDYPPPLPPFLSPTISTPPPPSSPSPPSEIRLAFGGSDVKSRKRMFPLLISPSQNTRSSSVAVAVAVGGEGNGKRGLRSGK